MTDIKIAAVIPARMASTRHPGKPLIEIQGLPMIEHVRRRALLCDGFSDVVVGRNFWRKSNNDFQGAHHGQ